MVLLILTLNCCLCTQALLSRETLLSTLARLLREDGPRSLEMAAAVAGCFYACSCIKELHRQLLDNQVGANVASCHPLPHAC